MLKAGPVKKNSRVSLNILQESMIHESPSVPQKVNSKKTEEMNKQKQLTMDNLIPGMETKDLEDRAKEANKRIHTAMEPKGTCRSVSREDKARIATEANEMLNIVVELVKRNKEAEERGSKTVSPEITEKDKEGLREFLDKKFKDLEIQTKGQDVEAGLKDYLNKRMKELEKQIKEGNDLIKQYGETQKGTKPETLKDIMKEQKETRTEILKEQREMRTEILKEQREMKTEILKEQEGTKEDIKEITNALQKTTYSGILKSQPRPPPSQVLHSLIVTSTDATHTSDQVIETMKKSVDVAAEGIEVQKLRKARNQKVVIGCKNVKEMERLKEKLEEGEGLKVEKAKNKNPLVIVRNVRGEDKKEQVLEAIKKKVGNLMGKEGKENKIMEVLFVKRTRNPHVAHVVVRVTPQIWQKLTDSGTVQLQWGVSRVEDQSPIIQCSRCLGYGHIKRVCQEEQDSCSHCGGNHVYADCPKREEIPRCTNCERAKLDNTNHNTFNGVCPIRAKWDKIARSRVAYC